MQFPRSFYITVLLAACVSSPLALAADEVHAKRKPLKDWIERLASDDAATRKSAADAIHAAVNLDGIFEPRKYLDDTSELRTHEELRAELMPLLPDLGKLLESEHDDCRSTVADMLAVLGPEAKDLEPALLRIIRSKTTSGEVGMAAVTALLHVAPRSRAVLPTLLELYDAQRNAKTETEEEAKRLNDHDEAVAGISATAIALMLANSGRAAIEVPTLVKLTASAYSRGNRLTFIYALAELGADCQAALPALRKLILDDDRRIRSAAGWAVLRIEGDTAELPAILKAMDLDPNASAEFQESVASYFKEWTDALKWLRDDPGEDDPDEIGQNVFQQLVRQASHENPFYQRQAIRLLGEIGTKAKAAVPALITAARSEDKFTRDVARAALIQIDPSAVPLDSDNDSEKMSRSPGGAAAR